MPYALFPMLSRIHSCVMAGSSPCDDMLYACALGVLKFIGGKETF